MKSKVTLITLSSLVTLVLATASIKGILNLSAGSLDPTFDGDGKVTTSLGGRSSVATDIAVQLDGKIIAAGFSYSENTDFELVRYNTDGSLDTSFEGDGKVTTDFGGVDDLALAVAVQSDGKVIAAGSANTDFALARYNTDGSLDASFDGDGKVTTDFGSPTDWAYDISLQPDGKIVAAGSSWNRSGNAFALARFNTDGSLDTSFDVDGRVTTLLPYFDEAFAVAIQADGKIVAGGGTNPSVFGSTTFALVRYDPNGSLDTTFDDDGIVAVTSGLGAANAVVIQADSKIVAASSSDGDFAVARYNNDGSPDTSFDGDGVVTTTFYYFGVATAIAIQPDGKIVAAGYRFDSSVPCFCFINFDFVVARINPNGSLDTSFDGDGKLTTDFGNFNSEAYAVALQTDGKVVAAGYASNGTSQVFALARYIGDGISRRRVRADFDGDGRTDVSVWRPSEGNWYLLQSRDGFTGINWGAATDEPVPGDYDNDGRADTAVYRPGAQSEFHVLKSSGFVYAGYSWGTAGDVPVVGDYDGDGSDDVAVFRPSVGGWYSLDSSTGIFRGVTWGQAGDVPVPADYDGDGRTDQAVRRGADWYLFQSTAGFSGISWGFASDRPVPADYDGDDHDDIAVFRENVGGWYILRSTSQSFLGITWGQTGDVSVPGDYDGDGRDDQAVFRNGEWYILGSTAGFTSANWGLPTDVAVPAKYVP